MKINKNLGTQLFVELYTFRIIVYNDDATVSRATRRVNEE